MIDQGNLMDSPNRSFKNGLWSSEAAGTIDQGNLMKFLGMRCNKFALIMKNLFSTEMRNP